ncbi:sulfatase [Halostella salina]|uniref:sulfatase n=1 Tax=Halostella salina TaxID=1547897 RepID=UPI001F089714|nr:sulfatase [Halostella salina]
MTSRPNVLWITLDSVRADHTSMDGYSRDTTPRMQAVANLADGRSFSNCFATGNSTPKSTGSMLTGTYPTRHGLGISNEYLPENIDTVPELFRRVGYATAGLTRNSYVSSGTGLDRGFDRFEWVAASTMLDAVDFRTIAKYLFNIRKHSAGLSLDTAKHATPYLLNEMAKQWLADLARDEPFFMYLHYNEPHRPYFPPLPYLDRYTDHLDISASEAAEISMRVHYELEDIVADGCDLTETELAAVEAMYDAEIAYTDEQVGNLLDYLRSLDLSDTVVVITGDHGELFGERGLLAHDFAVNDAVTRVPLVISGLDDVEYPTDELIQHIDVLQTILSRAGGETDQFQGIDLRTGTRDHVLSQRGPANFEPYLNCNPDFDTSRYHEGTLTGLRTHQYRLKKSENRVDLHALPDETTDVADAHPKIAAELNDELSEWLATEGQPIATGEDSELSEAMQKQLRDLGYME